LAPPRPFLPSIPITRALGERNCNLDSEPSQRCGDRRPFSPTAACTSGPPRCRRRGLRICPAEPPAPLRPDASACHIAA